MGVFNSVQKSAWKESAKNIDKFIIAVEKAFNEMDCDTFDNVFLSVECRMEDSLCVDGNNTFPMRHMGKNKLWNEGLIPKSIKRDPLLIAHGRELLDAQNNMWAISLRVVCRNAFT